MGERQGAHSKAETRSRDEVPEIFVPSLTTSSILSVRNRAHGECRRVRHVKTEVGTPGPHYLFPSTNTFTVGWRSRRHIISSI